MLKDRIENLVRLVGEHVDERYERVERVTARQRNLIRERGYIHTVVHLPSNTKCQILTILERSWNNRRMKNGKDHGKSRDWGRAISGFAHYLLKPTDMDEVDILAADDLVVRMSRWRHSNMNCNLWNRFIPYAQDVVTLAWRDIEPLYEGGQGPEDTI